MTRTCPVERKCKESFQSEKSSGTCSKKSHNFTKDSQDEQTPIELSRIQKGKAGEFFFSNWANHSGYILEHSSRIEHMHTLNRNSTLPFLS